MTPAVATMDLDHALSKRPPDDSPENDAIDPAGGVLRKRKRSRKIQSERKFECTFEGCGKSYSRAEHLYRHQLNRMPYLYLVLLSSHQS